MTAARSRSLEAWVDGLSDARLVGLVAVVAFLLAAWPLLLVPLPPLQDLPNHLAAAHIVEHPDIFPQYTFNGFFKSNSLLPLWFHLFGPDRLFGAARAFTALVLAANAIALPLLVLRFAGRSFVPVAALFFWPLVHGFFVSMGMMNFTMGFALSLILLVLLDRQRERPTAAGGLGIAVLSVIVWYAHAFPLAVVAGVAGLAALRRPTWRQRLRDAGALFLPLAPAAVLAAVSAQHHLAKVEGATGWARSFVYQNPWEILLHLWTDASGAFTRWGSMTLLPALLLPVFVWRQQRAERARAVADGEVTARPLLSWTAQAMLAAGYVGLPVMLSNWWHFNCRLVPFLWAGMLVRLPPRLPRPIAGALLVCALSFSVVTGIDYVRLDRDRREFTAAMDVLPPRATLLPLMFRQRKSSTFTSSLTHAWGFYTAQKDASAPLVFAVERSYPITYREFPPRALIPPALDRLAESMGTPAGVCKRLGQFSLDAACYAAWRQVWSEFWLQAEPRFSHVVTWAMPAEARPLIPARYRRIFASGDLEAFARE